MTMESLPNFEEIDVQKYLQVLQRRWLPVVGIFGMAVTVGSLYAFSLKPSYKAEGSLMIKSNRTSSLTGLTQDIGHLEALNQNKILENLGKNYYIKFSASGNNSFTQPQKC